MSTFQILSLAGVALCAAATFTAAARRKIGKRAAVAWTLLWSVAGTALAWPRMTAVVANALGIARGADLVFYCAILAGFVAFFLIYVRLTRLEESVTRLVRHLAIREAAQREPPEAP